MRRRRLWPRISLRSLAIVVAIIACCLWWVIWPKKVADQVTELLNARKYNELSPILAAASDREFLEYLEYITQDAPPSHAGRQ
jgi:hypothetical protein